MTSAYGIVHDSSELRKLIAENPDLPLVILADDEANNGDYAWMYCSCVDCNIDTLLDVNTPYNSEGMIFTDEYELEDAIVNSIPYDDPRTEEEIDDFVRAELAKYRPYWRKVIAIYVSN